LRQARGVNPDMLLPAAELLVALIIGLAIYLATRK
jgi:hypothetical protein